METAKISVAITVPQAARLRALTRSNELGKARFVARVGPRIGRENARLAVARLAPRRWPTIEAVVAGALRERLAEPDLAGPWAPLTEKEAARLALSGRWPGPALDMRLVKRNYSLPSDLVTALRCASWRVSAEPLAEMRDRGLVGALGLSPDAVRARDALAARVHSPGRIVRQALERYGPGATGA